MNGKLAIALAALAFLLTGCGSQPGGGSVAEFTELFGGQAVDYDWERSPAALAGRSTLVVQGTIARIDKGRLFGTSADDPVIEPKNVMVLNVKRVLRGSLAADANNTVYVELPAPMSRPAADFDRVAPKTADVVLYLVPAPAAGQTPLVDPDAGRPAGQPLYQPINPQGFAVDNGGSVVLVLELAEFKGAKLAQFLPDSAQFPTP